MDDIGIIAAYYEKPPIFVSAFKDNLNTDVLWYLGTHELTESTLISIKINETLMNPHLPAVPGCCPFPIRTFSDGYYQLSGRKGNRTGQIDTGPLSDLFNLFAHFFYFLIVGSGESDSGLLHDNTEFYQRICFLTTLIHMPAAMV